MQTIKQTIFSFFISFLAFQSSAQVHSMKNLWYLNSQFGVINYNSGQDNQGNITELGLGLQHNVSRRFSFFAELGQGNIYNQFGQYDISSSSASRVGAGIKVSPFPLVRETSSGIKKARVSMNLGYEINATVLQENWTPSNPRPSWAGTYLWTRVSISFDVKVGEHLYLGSKFAVVAPNSLLDNSEDIASIGLHMAYDFHRNAEEQQVKDHNLLKLRFADRNFQLEQATQQLKADSSDKKFVVERYESLILEVADEKDSLAKVVESQKKANKAMDKEIVRLAKEIEQLETKYDSVSKSVWCDLEIVRSPDSSDIVLARGGKESKGTFYTVYTGENNQVTDQLYDELQFEYNAIWMVANPFDLRRIVIYLSEEEKSAQLPELVEVFPDIETFERSTLR